MAITGMATTQDNAIGAASESPQDKQRIDPAGAGNLNYLGVAGDRFRVEWVSAAEGARFAQVMNDFAEHIAGLGVNVKLRDLRCAK